jgi:cytochrome oxidase Cu insertion factor (SCO1/SenC/PrrC family)
VRRRTGAPHLSADRTRAVTRCFLAICCALGVLLGKAESVPAEEADAPSAAALMDALMWGQEPIGGPFELIDHTGARRTDTDYRGKLALIYFGYTYCPDVCPTDLQAMASALDLLGDGARAVQPLFITIDPERDTPGHLANYVSLFHPRLVGLTGDADAVRGVARAYKVYYAKVVLPDSSDYAMDHSAFIYLVNADGQYLGFFPPGTSPERMATIIQPHLSSLLGERR